MPLADPDMTYTVNTSSGDISPTDPWQGAATNTVQFNETEEGSETTVYVYKGEARSTTLFGADSFGASTLQTIDNDAIGTYLLSTSSSYPTIATRTNGTINVGSGRPGPDDQGEDEP